MLIASAIVRVVERFSITDNFFEPQGEYYGLIIGLEIAITWSTLLVAEFIVAMKYFQMSSQLPAVVSGQKSINQINTKSTRAAMTVGCLA